MVQQCLWSVSWMRTSVVSVLVGGRAGDTGIPGHASRLARQGHRDTQHAVLSQGGGAWRSQCDCPGQGFEKNTVASHTDMHVYVHARTRTWARTLTHMHVNYTHTHICMCQVNQAID